MVLGGRVAGGTAILALLMCMPHRGLTFTFVRRSSPLHKQQQRQQQRASSSACPSTGTVRKRRQTNCIRCAAVALAVSGSSVCEDDDTHSESSLAAAGAQRIKGATGDVGDVVVLSDWLDEPPVSSLGLPDIGDGHGNVDFRGRGQVEVVGDNADEEQTGGDGTSAPFRFQQLIQHMWAEVSRDNQLEYLGGEGQGKVKGALTVLAAYCALREHPLQAGVDSPQQAFSEMDFNRDGEVSFDEFVRWYSMSIALDEPQTDGGATPTTTSASPPGAPLARTETLAPTAGSRASWLLADVEKSLARTGRHPLASATGAGQAPRPATTQVSTTEAVTEDETGADSLARGQDVPGLMALTAAAGAALGPTEEEKESARERWLAGEAAEVGTKVAGNEVTDDSASKDLEKALEMLCILVKGNADAETLVAALASCIIRNPMGRYNLEVIEEQFGPIIRGIVEDRLLLERLPEPTSSTSYLAIQQSFGVKPVLDLDDNHAKLMRDYLVHSSRDARAVVVHMADLTCRLRDPNKTPEHERHTLALEALQLYVPVSNALGLGSSFRELEELGYKTIFPQTYSNMALWHRDVKGQSHDIIQGVKRRMLEALHEREDIASRVHSYRIEGRTKALVSTFRKVFRQNKRATDVHDIIGFRIIVHPKSPGTRASAAAAAAAAATGVGREISTAEKEKRKPKVVDMEQDRAIEKKVGAGRARSVFTVKTFPPPYRDADSRLLHDVYEVLVRLYDEVPGRFKNYVDFPKKNGYRSVHTTVVHPTGLKMEFQVRTAHMHAEAEGGSASHSLYKGNLENPEEASLFRSKMTPNILSPAHRHQPKIDVDKSSAATVWPPVDDPSPPHVIEEDGAAAATVSLIEAERVENDAKEEESPTPQQSEL
ncbi:unnamed protein product [Scytosiphon promiscuus]